MSQYKPPYQLTSQMVHLVAQINELIGQWKAQQHWASLPHLRKQNQIKTIHASLAIEQNTLSLQQVTAVIEGKTVLGHPKEIQEVRNALQVYELLEQLDPYNIEDLLKAHGLMLYGLTEDAGQFRSSGVGIYHNKTLVHMPPQGSRVPMLIAPT